MPFRPIEHTADVGLEITGKDLPELFREAAQGLYSLLIKGKPHKTNVLKNIELSAPDAEGLLVAWLNELLYCAVTANEVYTEFHFRTLEPQGLYASVLGEKRDSQRLPLVREIKAATYHQLKIQKIPSGLQTTVIFDV